MSVPNDKISKMLAVFKVKEFCVLARRRRVVFFVGLQEVYLYKHVSVSNASELRETG